MKVLVCDSIAKDAIKIMEDKGLQVDVKTGQTEDQLCQIIGAYDAAIVRSATKITAKVLDAGTNLKVVARGGVGLDNIDVKTAEKKNIKVVNTPEASTNSVAELAVGLMLSAARFIPQADASLKKGQWEKKKYEGHEIAGKTLALIGAGRIGAMTGEKAMALGMKVVAYDPFIQKHSNPRISMMSLDDCLRVAVAAVDVWAKEPTDNATLANHERVIALPHLGASTHEGQARVGGAVAQRIVDALGL
jgi:phosphoglycerate dehydrogenase-like enzyme